MALESFTHEIGADGSCTCGRLHHVRPRGKGQPPGFMEDLVCARGPHDHWVPLKVTPDGKVTNEPDDGLYAAA